MGLYNLLAVIIAFILVVSGGCAPLEQGKKDFVAERNTEVGNRFTPSSLPDPIQVTPLENGKTRYLFLEEETGCRWSYEVDDKTEIIEFWQYEGNPNLCR